MSQRDWPIDYRTLLLENVTILLFSLFTIRFRVRHVLNEQFLLIRYYRTVQIDI